MSMFEYEDRQVQGPRRKVRVRALLVMGACQLPAATTHARAACLAAVTVIEPLRGITFSSFVVQRTRLDLVASKVQSRGEAKTNEKSETNCISNEH